ncbi:serine hydrolase [Streptomyces sp. NPDC005813]|uniref:serine hydrolase n=1 Tax=Streptomyces sp. NPDC005813 TaxID=3155592 RepID=UPI0033FF765C
MGGVLRSELDILEGVTAMEESGTKVGSPPGGGDRAQAEPEQVRRTVAEAFAAAGSVGVVHAVDIDSGVQFEYGADDPVALASVCKIPVLVELYARSDEGTVDLSSRVHVRATGRSPGPTGLSVMLDPVDLSLRDLAYWMISVSDNAATDVLCDLLGLDAVNARMSGLGLKEVRLEGTCRDVYDGIDEELGGADVLDLSDTEVARLRASRVLHIPTATRGTPRSITTLLSMIWRDRAASPEACAAMRRTLGLQVWPHRLRSGFPDDRVAVAGKTGTLPFVRNEVGVVEYPDGGRYAVAVFTCPDSLAYANPPADAVIGTVARAAVDCIRAAQPTD